MIGTIYNGGKSQIAELTPCLSNIMITLPYMTASAP